jgi:hypothetical protein
MRLTLWPVPGLRTKPRSPWTAMLTGVPTGVPSRRWLVSSTAHCRVNGSKAVIGL